MVKPSLARGMRDFTAQEIAAREYIFDTIKQSCRLFGYSQLDTPVIEQIEILTEKYGEEGDKLLFKILNSGDYLDDIDENAFQSRDLRRITSHIAEKGLRYDLTVPLARYVAMNRNELTFPFKRYQIGKVWRADRPQKGRYREFYQCDADAIGSSSLLYDAECIMLMAHVLHQLEMPHFVIKINNRKILAGLAEVWGFGDRFVPFTVAIDKWDKIGEEGVVRELGKRGFSETEIHRVQTLFRLEGTTDDKCIRLRKWLEKSEIGTKGINEAEEVLSFIKHSDLRGGEVQLDFLLARGLDYYTATIFECVLPGYPIGSIAAGGRYDELTASFGFPDMPGVGFSFGAERIFDVLKDTNKLQGKGERLVDVLVLNFGSSEEKYAFGIMQKLHEQGIAAEMYPEATKMKKQFQFAEKKKIPLALILGQEERENNTFSLKDLEKGEQSTYDWEGLLEAIGAFFKQEEQNNEGLNEL